MKIQIHSDIASIPADDWNALVRDNNPLVRHEFLQAMEENGCVGENFGWLPRHIAVYDGDRLAGAMPLYEKTNSYGEFVFDHAWADAYRRSGHAYFPKLVSAVPYTPCGGQRMLCAAVDRESVFPLLLRTALTLAGETGASSLHLLFPEAGEIDYLQQQGLMIRHDCQFHWYNQSYVDFGDFLGRLASRKRKAILKERRRVSEAGVRIRVLDGHGATPDDWREFSRFYARTFDEKWGIATFNEGFFKQVARTLPGSIVLVLADRDGETIAGSLMYRSDTTLYGRHWGCAEQVDFLHFEACYYQGIDYCIKHGLGLFEPGAQGEHKIARGFIPRITRSAHWLADDFLRKPIEHFVEHEKQAVQHYKQQMDERIPYRQEA
ncbi:MAG: GNAT family N-acetyltransferase [Gammaproteobacteria bacterium]